MENTESKLTNSCLVCGNPCRNKFCSISCSNKHWNPKTKTGKLKADALGRQVITLDLVCEKCQKPFSVTRERRLLQGKNIPKNCSRSCANSREHSEETRQKIAVSLTKEASVLESNHKAHPRGLHRKSSPTIRCSARIQVPCIRCGRAAPIGNTDYCSRACHIAHTQESILSDLASGVYAGRVIALKAIKRLLIRINGHACSICGISEWCGLPVPLVADHIDGRASNNALGNLRLVCANCDRQLPTFGSRNKNSDRSIRRAYDRRRHTPVAERDTKILLLPLLSEHSIDGIECSE